MTATPVTPVIARAKQPSLLLRVLRNPLGAFGLSFLTLMVLAGSVR